MNYIKSTKKELLEIKKLVSKFKFLLMIYSRLGMERERSVNLKI